MPTPKPAQGGGAHAREVPHAARGQPQLLRDRARARRLPGRRRAEVQDDVRAAHVRRLQPTARSAGGDVRRQAADRLLRRPVHARQLRARPLLHRLRRGLGGRGPRQRQRARHPGGHGLPQGPHAPARVHLRRRPSAAARLVRAAGPAARAGDPLVERDAARRSARLAGAVGQPARLQRADPAAPPLVPGPPEGDPEGHRDRASSCRRSSSSRCPRARIPDPGPLAPMPLAELAETYKQAAGPGAPLRAAAHGEGDRAVRRPAPAHERGHLGQGRRDLAPERARHAGQGLREHRPTRSSSASASSSRATATGWSRPSTSARPAATRAGRARRAAPSTSRSGPTGTTTASSSTSARSRPTSTTTRSCRTAGSATRPSCPSISAGCGSRASGRSCATCARCCPGARRPRPPTRTSCRTGATGSTRTCRSPRAGPTTGRRAS